MTPEETADWEDEWAGHPTPGTVGFIPYPLPEFRILLKAAIAAARFPAPTFIDLGAGIGSKVETAAQLGCKEPLGVEIYPAYIAEARRKGVCGVHYGDVRKTPVAGYGIVYLNHPLAVASEQLALEARIAAELSPGSVWICVHGLTVTAAGAHWETIFTTGRGAWVVRKAS